MKLSISNIAWIEEQDNKIYELMSKYGFCGLEIAPTRVFPLQPYENKQLANNWSEELLIRKKIKISSMQSIWYGRTEKIFGTQNERTEIFEYTKKAIEFAAAIGCGNLVFGCPNNRNLPEGVSAEIAVQFFYELGEYALKCGTVIGMEANPPIYNTNYINDTDSALQLIRTVNSKGFLLNLDVGTIIENQEDIETLRGNEKFINHVHISEPGLKLIEHRKLHFQLAELLKEVNYHGFISIEMARQESIALIEDTMRYVKEIFA